MDINFDIGDKVKFRCKPDDWFHSQVPEQSGVIDRKIILNSTDHYMVRFDDGTYSNWLEAHQLTKSNHKPLCECGNAQNPKGQGHSHWCPMFAKTI